MTNHGIHGNTRNTRNEETRLSVPFRVVCVFRGSSLSRKRMTNHGMHGIHGPQASARMDEGSGATSRTEDTEWHRGARRVKSNNSVKRRACPAASVSSVQPCLLAYRSLSLNSTWSRPALSLWRFLSHWDCISLYLPKGSARFRPPVRDVTYPVSPSMMYNAWCRR